jgi:alpha-tubulin suppressor-like RCC1 family protein
MKHTKERVKAMAQEVTGTVEVSNIAGIESLMKRGNLALEDSKWNEAYECFDKILDIDPEYAPVYIGMLCLELKFKNEADLADYKKPLDDMPYYQKALRFADASYRAKVTGYNQAIKDHIAEEQRRYQENLENQKEQIQKQKNYHDCISFGSSHIVGLKTDGTVVAVGYEGWNACDTGDWYGIVAITAREKHTVGLKADGTVVAVGDNGWGKCNTGDWRDIIAIAAGYYHTVGLKADGTVVVAGGHHHNRCDTSDWRDIIAIAAGVFHAVGLKADGTVVAEGKYYTSVPTIKSNNFDVKWWRDIIAIATGYYHIVGLKADGTVVTEGIYTYTDRSFKFDSSFRLNDEWRDIIAVAAGDNHIVGLKVDGTVVAVGDNGWGKCNTGDWRDIIAIAAGGNHVVGLKADGTVVAVGNNEEHQCNTGNWYDIVAVSAGYNHTVGLKADGTVVAVGITINYDIGKLCNIGPVDKEQILMQMHKREQEEKRRIEQSKEWAAQGLCRYCGGKLSLIGKKCKSCGEPQN